MRAALLTLKRRLRKRGSQGKPTKWAQRLRALEVAAQIKRELREKQA